MILLGSEDANLSISCINSGVDATTGTIQLKGSFTNTQERLVPGQFVKVILKLAEEPNAIAVPSEAVQTGQKGQYVYVVKAGQTVELRPVKAGETVGNETAIEQGLKPKEQVVIDGQFNLVPGTPVEVKTTAQSQGNNS